MARETSTKRPKRPATSKAATNPVSTSGSAAARRLRTPKYSSLRLSKRIKHPVKLPNVWKITKAATRLLLQHWKLVSGIVLVYGVLNIILVRGLNGGTDVSALKDQLNQLFQGGWGHIASSFTVFALLVSSSNSVASDAAGAYQTFLVLITSLALVWSFRQVLADKPAKVRVRDGFYLGIYPLIPVILVLLVVSLQLIPLLAGGWLYSTVIQNGIAVTGAEKLLWLLIFLLLALLSLYMVCSSIFALYIVTLPGITPMKALRSARELVRYRRWAVMRKLLFLPLLLTIFAALFMLPFILFAAVLAQWVFFILSMFGLAAAHAYIYTLYRELLNEKA